MFKIRSIVEQSAFLHERAGPSFRTSGLPAEADREAARRIERWCGKVAGGDEQRFARRLSWDGLTLEDAYALACGVRLTEGAKLPAWATALERIMRRAAEPGSELLTPFFDEAMAHVEHSDGWHLLADEACADLRADLCRGLNAIAAPTVNLEYSVWAAQTRYGGTTRDLFLVDLLTAYPVLARLLAEYAIQWGIRSREWLGRLEADWHELVHLFTGGTAKRVARLRSSRSDAHHGGRTVFEIRFDTGVECFYKPHSLDCEQAFGRILRWLNSHGIPLEFPVFKSLYRADYGWVEKADARPCADEGEAARYFTRAGMLLALLFVLEAGDCHTENVVAHGEYPVLVDMEALFQPSMPVSALGEREDAATRAGKAFFTNSVFRVGMLPRWISRNGRHENIGALNCDAAGKYIDEIVTGFETMYRFLNANASAMCAAHGCLGGADVLQPRFIFRNTITYTSLLASRLAPQWMRDGFDQSVEVDVLCRRFLYLEEKPAVWAFCNREKRTLLEGDVPRFVVPSSGSNEPDAVSFELGFATAVSHVQSLSKAELALQMAYIRLAFGSPTPVVTHHENSSDVLSRDALVDEVLAIARIIESTAIRAGDGSASWITRAYQPETPIWQLHPMTARLYDGLAGTALFFAAVERVLPGSGYRALAEDTFWRIADPVRSSENRRFRRDAGLGAGTGVPSVAYALSKGAGLLEDRGMASAAVEIARSISLSQIRGEKEHDLMQGVAGHLAVLIALYQERPDGGLLDSAKACGERLMALNCMSDGEASGLPHGALGVACALLRLVQCSGSSQHAEAALTLWDAAHTAPAGRILPVHRTSWCHGSAGRLIAELHAGLPDLDRAALLRDLEALGDEPISPLDHPCCGNAGRMEALLEGARWLGDDSLLGRAGQLASNVARRARASGHYALGMPKGFQLVSFHQGLAGVGYQMLRLIAPDELPSVLAWM